MPSSSSGSGSEGSESTVASRGERALKKGPWTAAEDAILLEYVTKHGEGNWNAVQRNSGLSRCGKSCRLRWANHLRPNLKKGSFSPEEERLILELHAKLGNKWARMAAQMPGRTDNEIKNYWNTRIKRRQRAGLPLYPPHIQRSANPRGPTPPLGNDAQLAAAQGPNPPSLDRIPFNFSLMPPSNPAAFGTLRGPYLMPEQQHRLKRPREESMVNLGAPFLARPLQAAPPPPALLLYGSENYDLCSPLVPQQLPFSVKMELPSSQLFAAAEPVAERGGEWGRGNNSGLLDALLEESHAVSAGGGGTQGRRKDAAHTEELLPRDSTIEKRNWLEENGSGIGDGDGSGPLAAPEVHGTPLALEAPPATWESVGTEKKMKHEVIDVIESAEDDLSALLDIIPVEPMPMPLPVNATLSDWYSGDRGEMSSNAQSSTMTGEEVGLEMQQLVATNLTIGDEDHKWSTGSPHWSNAPDGIC